MPNSNSSEWIANGVFYLIKPDSNSSEWFEVQVVDKNATFVLVNRCCSIVFLKAQNIESGI